MIDVNVYQEYIFHTKMILKEFELNDYLFGTGVSRLTEKEKKTITSQVKREMSEIFYGRNLNRI
jgi:S-adenosylmethionine decarboxylase